MLTYIAEYITESLEFLVKSYVHCVCNHLSRLNKIYISRRGPFYLRISYNLQCFEQNVSIKKVGIQGLN